MPLQALDLAEPLGQIERKILLAQLILKWAANITPDQGAPLVASNPASALALADQLGRLIDDMVTRQVSWDALDNLVPGDLDPYWEFSFRFLKEVRTQWPALLHAFGTIEAAERRDQLIEAETRRLKAGTGGPVIAAGSTGSMPSTAMLLETIASLPQGAIVLPGLDTDLDDASWQAILSESEQAIGHPQYGLASLLRRIGITRKDVRMLAQPEPHGREAFVSEALRPAASTDLWQARLADAGFSARRTGSLANMAVIEAAHSEEEAVAIAIALREAVDDGTPESAARRAALITPDRALARRVLAALERWQVPVDDSGGDPLSDTAAGIFARLAAQVALGGVEPVPLLALLKHPLCRLGRDDQNRFAAIEILERAILRGPRPRAGSAGLAHALQAMRDEKHALHRNDPRGALSDAELDQAASLIDDIAAALAPLEQTQADIGAFARSRLPSLRKRGKTLGRPIRPAGRVCAVGWRSAGADLQSTDRKHSGKPVCGRSCRLSRIVRRHRGRARGAPARRAGRARAHLWSAGSTTAECRSRRSGRPRGRNLAAGNAKRSMAQPPDAPRTRARSAGAAHRSFGARFRAGFGRSRHRADTCRESRRLADGAPHGSCSGLRRLRAKSPGKTRCDTARNISTGRARSIARSACGPANGPRRRRRSQRGRSG